MIFAVIVATLWYALLALDIGAELVGESTPNVGPALVALVIGGVRLIRGVPRAQAKST
jgi:hypothetical protein